MSPLHNNNNNCRSTITAYNNHNNQHTFDFHDFDPELTKAFMALKHRQREASVSATTATTATATPNPNPNQKRTANDESIVEYDIDNLR